MKSVKYTESHSIGHKLSFADKTRQHTTKMGSLLRKINLQPTGIYRYQGFLLETFLVKKIQ